MLSLTTEIRRLKLSFRTWLFKPNPSIRKNKMTYLLQSMRVNIRKNQLFTTPLKSIESYKNLELTFTLGNLSHKLLEFPITFSGKKASTPSKKFKAISNLKFHCHRWRIWTQMISTKWKNSCLKLNRRRLSFKKSSIELRASLTLLLQSSAKKKLSWKSKSVRLTWTSSKSIWNSITDY